MWFGPGQFAGGLQSSQIVNTDDVTPQGSCPRQEWDYSALAQAAVYPEGMPSMSKGDGCGMVALSFDSAYFF